MELITSSLTCSNTAARKANKKSVGLDDIAERDLEQGDAQLKTKQNISKLMSDAEKQYVAEYIKKSAPAGILRKQQPGVGAVPSNTVQDKITVQKLESGPQEAQGEWVNLYYFPAQTFECPGISSIMC